MIELSAGMVGYIAASIKKCQGYTCGDTVTLVDRPCDEALPGYKKVNPMVYCVFILQTVQSILI